MSAAFSIAFVAVALLYGLSASGHAAIEVAGWSTPPATADPGAPRRARFAAFAGPLLVAAFIGHAALVSWRWWEAGRFPCGSPFDDAVVGCWFVVGLMIWVARGTRYPIVAAGVLPIVCFFLIVAFVTGVEPALSAPVRSSWFFVHAFSGWIAGAAYVVACGGGILLLARLRAPGRGNGREAERLDELVFRAVMFGFAIHAVTLASGSLWYRQVSGMYWAGTPLETWSLASWLLYGSALHLRAALGWRFARLAWPVVIITVAILAAPAPSLP